ncbi:hypothetical protein IWQ60_002888 [Tieghemiomyces parasiticus]|uniref:Uncharacterized protein n=1 Tax=Tieghemiomyces parasiticus TaxID=78921 RepID=A0A9W8AAI4_9FUNG|nr:hypothetical protein IWQ60_002888 [Tieghemiomyces parasiticus]
MSRVPPAPPTHRLVMVGTGGVGKSALTVKFISGDFVQEYDPTKADSYTKQMQLEDGPCVVDILDTAGQEDYSAIQDNFYRHRDGFMLVFSLCEYESFQAMPQLRERILRVLDTTDDVPVVLVGNKYDLATRAYRRVSVEEAQELALSWNAMYLETSAKTGQNVETAYRELLRLVSRAKLRQSLAHRQKQAHHLKEAQLGAGRKDKACVVM